MTLPAPKHAWKFDETSGTTAADSAGGAVIALDRANWVPGRQGNAIRFNPNDGVGVKLATTSLAEMPPPWTAGVWVKREADSDGAALFSSNSYALKLEQWWNTHGVGFTKFTTKDAPGFDKALNYTAPLGQWVHLALVGTATEVTLYVNGERQGNIEGSVPLGLRWLGSTQGYVEFASAVLDEIQIFDQALTAAQVGELAKEGLTPSPARSAFDGIWKVCAPDGTPQSTVLAKADGGFLYWGDSESLNVKMASVMSPTDLRFQNPGGGGPAGKLVPGDPSKITVSYDGTTVGKVWIKEADLPARSDAPPPAVAPSPIFPLDGMYSSDGRNYMNSDGTPALTLKVTGGDGGTWDKSSKVYPGSTGSFRILSPTEIELHVSNGSVFKYKLSANPNRITRDPMVSSEPDLIKTHY